MATQKKSKLRTLLIHTNDSKSSSRETVLVVLFKQINFYPGWVPGYSRYVFPSFENPTLTGLVNIWLLGLSGYHENANTNFNHKTRTRKASSTSR